MPVMLRAVGTLEYSAALNQFDSFLRIATQADLDAADTLLARKPSYAIVTGLASRDDNTANTYSFSGAASSKIKKGLMWVVALARLEAGAILATFGTQSAPFEVVGPTAWEMPAYRELLMDGAQTHVQALANDSNVALLALKTADAQTLAYVRRINLVRAMLSAAARSNANQLTPAEWAVMEAQDRQLVGIRNRLAIKVKQLMQLLNADQTASQTTVQQKNIVRACGLQLEGEARELAAGTARVQVFRAKR